MFTQEERDELLKHHEAEILSIKENIDDYTRHMARYGVYINDSNIKTKLHETAIKSIKEIPLCTKDYWGNKVPIVTAMVNIK